MPHWMTGAGSFGAEVRGGGPAIGQQSELEIGDSKSGGLTKQPAVARGKEDRQECLSCKNHARPGLTRDLHNRSIE